MADITGRRGAGAPHRPGALFGYQQHDSFEPSFLVDVTPFWGAKMRALDAYASQLAPSDGRSDPAGGAETKISSPLTRRMLEGRARHWGNLIGVELAEPFSSRTPLAVADPWELLPRGLR